MESFFAGLEPSTAMDLAAMSRRAFELREQRKRMLDESGFVDPHALLEAVREGRVDARAGYDLWLALALLQEQHGALRGWIDWRCRGTDTDEPEAAPWAQALAEHPLPEPFDSALTLHPDAISLDAEGMTILARILSAREWSVEWRIYDRSWRLDTAPALHKGIDSRVRLHRPDGSIAPDSWGFEHLDSRVAVLQHFLGKVVETPEP